MNNGIALPTTLPQFNVLIEITVFLPHEAKIATCRFFQADNQN